MPSWSMKLEQFCSSVIAASCSSVIAVSCSSVIGQKGDLRGQAKASSTKSQKQERSRRGTVFLAYYPPESSKRSHPNFLLQLNGRRKSDQSTVFLGCARRGQRAVGDPSTTGLFVYV